jgi:hypothetical protein
MGAAASTGDLRPTTFNRHLGNVYPALAMLAGMQLEVFTPLAEGPMSVDELAARLAVQPRKLKPLLYALVVGGLLEVDGERFANTAESNEFLVVGKPALPRWHAWRLCRPVVGQPAYRRLDPQWPTAGAP